MIAVSKLTKSFGRFTAVSDLTLKVNPGEIYGVLGPNGAGKTTAIKAITGLLRPTSGTITVCGYDVVREPERAKRRIGYISDEPHPYDRLTGREFLLTVAALYGVRGKLREERVREGLGLFELGPWADELTESYSHGMRQKLMVAAALLHDPEVLVADEPLVGLDPLSARRLKELFRSLVGRGRAILMATHILDIAEKLCDRVGIIMGGRLLAEGTVQEIKDRARTPGHNLEDVFLSLTAEAPGGTEGAGSGGRGCSGIS